MKSSLEKFGRKLTIHKNDAKDKRDHHPSAHLDELLQASKDMLDMRNCYDGLLSAAAAMMNSIYEFSESLHGMGTCLLEKTAVDADGESGKVLSTLGNIQSQLQKVADTYRSYVILTITNPSESLLSELQKVEEMKLQCDEKRDWYEHTMAQNKEKGKLKSGKVENSTAQRLQEAQDEYHEVARLCAFRVKSLKEGQCRSLLTQATRHHAAQLNFFRKGLEALEAVDPSIRVFAEKHRIDYQLSGLDYRDAGEGEGMSSRESTDDGELSFDYRQKKRGLDKVGISSNPMELDMPHPHVPTSEDGENKHQEDGRQSRESSYSAPIYPDKMDSSRETSYVLPTPRSNPFHNFRQALVVEHDRDFGNDARARSTIIIDSNGMQLPAPSQKLRQAYSGPLPPTNPLSGKIASMSGPLRSSVSPPVISELHELPRPPTKNQETNKRPTLTSPLPPPPLVVTRRHVEASSPPLTPVLLSNMKSPLSGRI